MTLLCICFRYSLCSIGFLSSPKINIMMYFSHHFPLTSHIRGHLLSTWMAPLCLSADIPHISTQKDIYGLRVSQNTIDGLIMNYIHHPSSWLFLPFRYVNSCTWLFRYATRVLYASIGCCMSRIGVYASYPHRNSWVIHELPVLIPAYIYLWH